MSLFLSVLAWVILIAWLFGSFFLEIGMIIHTMLILALIVFVFKEFKNENDKYQA